ncbi:hypothetical protein RRG08_064320 [Elysia crispata]|uniref:Uncharacterized protein n=1 Tax=Elysia crispata TaxID=231223 RepID=A0AAE0ZYS1_9GAST|nr:hypothetical protein RRG08_064320 [Elysia crispata]
MRLRDDHAARRKTPHLTLLHRSQGSGGGPSGDAHDDDGGIPQPVWRGRMPEVTAEERDDQPCCLWLLGPPEGDDRKARPGTDYPDRTSLGPWDRGVPNERLEDGRRIPDVAVTEGDSPVYIDITVPFDDPANLYRAAADKEENIIHISIRPFLATHSPPPLSTITVSLYVLVKVGLVPDSIPILAAAPLTSAFGISTLLSFALTGSNTVSVFPTAHPSL